MQYNKNNQPSKQSGKIPHLFKEKAKYLCCKANVYKQYANYLLMQAAKDCVTELPAIRIINWFCRTVTSDICIRTGAQRGFLS